MIELIRTHARRASASRSASFTPKRPAEGLEQRVKDVALAGIKEACSHPREGRALRRLQARSRRQTVGDARRRSSPEHEKLIKAEFEERKLQRRARAGRSHEGKRIDGRDHMHGAPDQHRGRLPAARARLGAVPARRDAGDRARRRSAPRATSRRSTRSTGERWKRFLLHYNFPPFSSGEDQADARPRPSRDRPRRSRRARARRA